MGTKDIFEKAASMIAETKQEKEAKKKLLEEDRKAMIEQLGAHMERILTPVLSAMVENANVSRQELLNAVSNLKIDTPQVPEIIIPPINVPQPKVTVQAPEVRVPQVNIPKADPVVFPDRMAVTLEGVGHKQPLPMLMVDVKGKPVQMGSAVAGGGKADFFTIKDIQTSSGASLIDQIDGALKITGSLSASLSLDYGSGEIGDNTARFVQATDAISSVNVVSTIGLTDTELRATSVPVEQVSGSIWSTEVTNSVTVDGSAVVQPVSQVSGAQWSTLARPIQVRGSLTTAYATLVDSSEDTLVSASAGSYLDLIEVMCANTSDAAQTVHLRDASGGNIVASLVIPAESTAGIANTVPLPQGNVGNAWTVQNAGSDLSNTTIYVTAKFSQEV